MVRKSPLSKRLREAGWAQLRTILVCKAAWAGKRVVLVAPAHTTPDCSWCGACVATSLSVRSPVCPACRLVLDRDANAASAIVRAGQACQGAGALVPVLN